MNTSSDVAFDDRPQFDPMPNLRPEPPTLVRRLTASGITKSKGEAGVFVAVVLTVLISSNVYLFARVVPEAPTLGADTLRSGEEIPAYVANR